MGKLQLKRGTKANKPALSSGEVYVCTDVNEVIVNNGADIIMKPEPAPKDKLVFTLTNNIPNGLSMSLDYTNVADISFPSAPDIFDYCLVFAIRGFFDSNKRYLSSVEVTSFANPQEAQDQLFFSYQLDTEYCIIHTWKQWGTTWFAQNNSTAKIAIVEI